MTKSEKRSNHFSDEAIDRGFPDHISADGRAYYGDTSVERTAKAADSLSDQNQDSSNPSNEENDPSHSRIVIPKDGSESAAPKTFADGYCEYCSQLSYPLTRALESTGVPTGEKTWQQSYGPNKVKALADHEYRLRRLLLALEAGKPKEIEDARQWANFSLEFHAKVRQRLTVKAQERDPSTQATGGFPVNNRTRE